MRKCLVPPPGPCFNPFVPGVYNAAIDVRSLAGAWLGEVADQVNVAAAVPEPASMVLLGSGLLLIACRGSSGRRPETSRGELDDLVLRPVAVVVARSGTDEAAVSAVRAQAQVDVRVSGHLWVVKRL